MLKKIKNIIKKNNILKNTVILFSGQSISSVISLFNTLIFIRTVGIYGNGVLAITQSYSGIFNSLFNFQSYAAMIKYGADSLNKDDNSQLKKYIKQAFVQDIITSIIAFVFGLILLNKVASFMKWNHEIIEYTRLYLITIIFNVTGSITGVLRLYDKFNIIAKIGIITPVIKGIGLIIGIILKLDLAYYIFLEILSNILSNILLMYYGNKVLKQNKLDNWYKEKIYYDKEFTKFNIYNNIVSTLDMPTVQLTNIIINKLLGINELGIYNILTKIGNILNRIIIPIGQSLLPELSKMVSSNNIKQALIIVKKMFTTTNMIGSIMILIILLTGSIWVDFFIPYNFNNILTLNLYILYIAITGSIIGINQIFVVFNLVKYNIPIVGIVNFLYLIFVYFSAKLLGLNGIIICLLFKEVAVGVIKTIIIKNNILS